MLDEIRANMDSLERHSDTMSMHEQRTRLAIIERGQNYFDQSDWTRFQALAKRFHDAIMQKMGATMGS